MLALGGASLLISVLLAWRITRSIVRPLHEAVQQWAVAAGDLCTPRQRGGTSLPCCCRGGACRAACAR